MKFGEAFEKGTGKSYLVEELEEILKKNGKLSEDLYCPYCKSAMLTYVDANPFHLRTCKGKMHEDSCILDKEEMSLTQTKKIVDAKGETLKNAMKGFLKLLNRESTKSSNDTIIDMISMKVNSDKKKTKNKTVKIYKNNRITNGVREEYCNSHQFFYGIAKYEVVINKDKYELHLLKDKNKEKICILKITKKVYEHLDEEKKKIINNGEGHINICFVGTIKKDKEFICIIENSQYILFENNKQ